MSFPLPISHPDKANCASPNPFWHYRFEKTDVPLLFRLAHQHRASPPELLPLIETLSQKPIGAFASLGSLHANCHNGDSTISLGSIEVMRDLLLEIVDRQLQGIYREYLKKHPPEIGATHEQRIAALEATRDQVLSVLHSYNWHWLAGWLELERLGQTAESCVGRLANFAFLIESVFLLFTRHCNISCTHCYNNSGPRKKADRIPLDRMLAIIAQMPSAGISHLAITGGEPFLYPQDLRAVIEAGRGARLDGIRIYTNAFWASTDERAQQTLDRLACAGFMQGREDYIKISGGVYHEEFIRFERILTAARAYYGRFGKNIVIDFELPPRGGSAVANEVRNRLSTAGLTDRVSLSLRQVEPHGRGEQIDGINLTSIRWPCPNLDAIMINPDETAQPCAAMNHGNNGIVLGRANQHDLKTLVKRMQNDPILQFLATKPMEEILAYVAKERRLGGYSGVCQVCQHALGDLTDREPLQAALFAQQSFYPFWFTPAEIMSLIGRSAEGQS